MAPPVFTLPLLHTIQEDEMGYLRATLILVVTLLPAAPVAAQTPRTHIVDCRALDEMMLQQSAADEAKRQAIREVLHREEVRAGPASTSPAPKRPSRR
jgi:hypothetical protein